MPLQENNFYPSPTAGVPLLRLLFWVSTRNNLILKGGLDLLLIRKAELEACLFSPKFNKSTSKALHSSASLISGMTVQSFQVRCCHDRGVRPISPNLCEFIESQEGVTQQGNLVWACFQNQSVQSRTGQRRRTATSGYLETLSSNIWGPDSYHWWPRKVKN